MSPDDWELLKMLPPSANHDPFHDFVTLDGRLTDKGVAIQRFVPAMLFEAAKRRARKV